MFVLESGTQMNALAVSKSVDLLKLEASRDAGKEVDWVASSATGYWHGSYRKPEGLVHYTIRSIRKVGK
jgi:hypothetical protein